jgi:uncharacterized protein (TIGR03437 family)
MNLGTENALRTPSAEYVRKFIVRSIIFIFLLSSAVTAQVSGLTASSVSGPFFFRHLEFSTDISGNFTDCRSALGTITFDGAGHYTLTAQQTISTQVATPLTGGGSYSIGASGVMTIGNPQRNNLTINARVGTEAIVGSTTESGDNTFDLFVAVPAASAAQAAAVFTGTYQTASLEFPLGVSSYARNSLFNLTPVAGGVFAQINGIGHALNLNSGQVTQFSLPGTVYTLNGDGTASATLGSTNTLLSGFKTLLISASGNIVLGGSLIAGSHDFLIGVKTAAGTAASPIWTGLFFTGGLRYDGKNPSTAGYVGSAHAIPSLSTVVTIQREHQINTVLSAFDFTGSRAFSVNGDGTLADGPLNTLVLAANGQSFAAADVQSTAEPLGFSLDFGISANALSGAGVYLNPQGVFNAASFAPAGAPIAPGEFVTLFGSGLGSAEMVASPPYPTLLGGVSVSINSVDAPIYLVSSTQLNVVVPYSVTGVSAAIVVTNNGQASNTVTVQLSASAPGVFSQNGSGTGPGVVVHSDNTLVTSSKPAKKGEAITIYVTGLGAVSPPATDGAGGLSTPLSKTVEAIALIFGNNVAATVSYSGLAPGFPGLYQINTTVPSSLTGTGQVPVAIRTGEAFAQQITISIQ